MYEGRGAVSNGDNRAGDARRFLADVEGLVSRAAPGEPVHGLEEIDGTDSTGTVFGAVDVSGHLIRIGFDDRWWAEVGSRRVGPAILQAVRAAKDKATAARMLLQQYGHPLPVAPFDPASMFTDIPYVPLPDYDDEKFEDALSRTLRRAEQIMANAEKFSELRDAAAERTVSGPRGLFQLVVTGSQIVEARVDSFMVGPGSGPELAADALDALRLVQAPAGLTGERR